MASSMQGYLTTHTITKRSQPINKKMKTMSKNGAKVVWITIFVSLFFFSGPAQPQKNEQRSELLGSAYIHCAHSFEKFIFKKKKIQNVYYCDET